MLDKYRISGRITERGRGSRDLQRNDSGFRAVLLDNAIGSEHHARFGKISQEVSPLFRHSDNAHSVALS